MIKAMRFTVVIMVVFQGLAIAQVKQPNDSSRQFLLEAAREIINSAG